MTLEKLIAALGRIVVIDPDAAGIEVEVVMRSGQGLGVRYEAGPLDGVGANRTTRRIVLSSSIDVR